MIWIFGDSIITDGHGVMVMALAAELFKRNCFLFIKKMPELRTPAFIPSVNSFPDLY